MNSTASAVQLGTLIANAESVTAAEIAIADGSILIGDATGVGVANAVTGDVVISNTGVTNISAGVILNADVNAAAAIAYSKLAALTSANILLGSAGNVATVTAVSGDITIGNTGVTAIGSGKVLKAMLATGIVPSHVIKFAGESTTPGGSATVTISVAGAVAGDYVAINVKSKGAGAARSVVTAAAGTDNITVVMSGDPSTDHVLQYFVWRATT